VSEEAEQLLVEICLRIVMETRRHMNDRNLTNRVSLDSSHRQLARFMRAYERGFLDQKGCDMKRDSSAA
jgi:hypothetical protein